MTPFDFHTFRDWNARLGRFVRFAPVVGDAPDDANGEPTPGEAPERTAEGSDGDSDSRDLDQRLVEMKQLLDEWNAELSSGDLSADNPFKGLDAALLPTAQRLLDEAYRELSTQYEQNLATALAEFRETQGPIQQELSDVLLAASNSWGLSEETSSSSGSSGILVQEEDSEIQDGHYTVKSGDTMYGILTKQLSADPALKQNTATHYGLNENLPPSDFVLQLFRNVPRLKQDLIYPGDTVLFQARGGILYYPKSPKIPPAPEQPEEAPASMGDALAQLDDEPAAADAELESESESESDADQDDHSRGPMLEDDTAGDDAEAGSSPAAGSEPAVEATLAPAEPAPDEAAPAVEAPAPAAEEPTPSGDVTPEAAPEEVRLPQNLQDFMASFLGLRILEKDLVTKIETEEVYDYETDSSSPENRVTLTLSRFALRGKIYSVEDFPNNKDDFTASASDKDKKKAYPKALARLIDSFRPRYDELIAKDKEEHQNSNEIPDNFPDLKEFLALPENSDLYDVKVVTKPQNPEKVEDPYRCPITVTFEVDGYSGKVELRWPKNPEIEGGTDVEALINAYAAVMRDLPNAVIETRQKAADRDETKLRDADGKVEGPPVGDQENLDYFLNSLEQKPNGTIAFELFDPVTGYHSRYPCKITLSSKGVLKIESFRRPALTFQLSFTATPYGKKTEQEFHGIRLLRTDQPPAPGVKGHGEVSQNPGHPWIDQITNDRGQVMARDIVLSEQFLYDVTRKILQQNALFLDDSEQPPSKDQSPSDFSGQYVFSNNFDNIARITPEDMRLRTGGERMWIQKVE